MLPAFLRYTPFILFKVSKFLPIYIKDYQYTGLDSWINLSDGLAEFNISLAQLPKISKNDAGLPEGCEKGDVVKIFRVDEIYYRVVI